MDSDVGLSEDSTATVKYLEDQVEYKCPLGKIKNRLTLQPGDKRNVKWKDGLFYEAEIIKIETDGSVTVKYAEDKVIHRTTLQSVEKCTLQIGDIRHVKWTDGKYYPAMIKKLGSDKTAAVKGDNYKTPESQAESTIPSISLHNDKASKVIIASGMNEDFVIPNNHPDYNTNNQHASSPTLHHLPDLYEKSSLPSTFSEDNNEIQDSPFNDQPVTSPTLEHESVRSGTDETPSEEDDSDNDPKFCAKSSQASSTSSEDDNATNDKIETGSKNICENSENPDCNMDNSTIRLPTLEDEYDMEHNIIDSQTDAQKVVVAQTSNLNNKRSWDKKFPCIFCKSFVTKLPRHFKQLHSQEKDVVKLESLPPCDPERVKILNRLRNAGLYLHNSEVLTNKKGTLIPKYRKVTATSPSKLIPCVYCNQFYTRKILFRHKKICEGRNKTNAPVGRVINTAQYMLPTSSVADYRILLRRSIIAGMRDGPEKHEIENDDTIMQFGAEMFEKLVSMPGKENHIRNKLRELGRFMVCVKKRKPLIKNLSELLKPEEFNTVVDATMELAGFDCSTNQFQIPTLAKKIGESIQKCVAIERKIAIISRNEIRRKDIDDFMSVFDVDWGTRITSKALNTLYTAKFNNSDPLPDAEDTKKLSSFIISEKKRCLDAIERDVNSDTYTQLLKITLACVIVFNKKRVGDAHNLGVTAYITGTRSCETNDNIVQHLKDSEKHLIGKLTRIETRGKRGKKVAILLTPELKKMMDILLHERTRVGVIADNKHFFAIPGTYNSHYRGSDIIRDVRTKAKLKYPLRITGTNLRKEAATIAAASGLSEAEVDILATFLGHDKSTHRKYYRLPEETLQKAKTSPFFTSQEVATSRAEDMPYKISVVHIRQGKEPQEPKNHSHRQMIDRSQPGWRNITGDSLFGYNPKMLACPVVHNCGQPEMPVLTPDTGGDTLI
ncbi:uncharacterized protein LOC128981936 [Macrosteles quadrilineatus]|uniref:uncharacterized protein LOC128981936 n=1 Tax=Macrosteles quadrilineatus TaxID=74068 RepID=UPI0023E22566|nr:uncharacterized protein LOC128981936 [Macrosteles quadrilineatus]